MAFSNGVYSDGIWGFKNCFEIRGPYLEFYFEEDGMFSHIDDITINYEEEGVLVVKELAKEVLTKGAWSTIVFKYQQWEAKKEAYGADRYTIRRYRKRNDEYTQQSKFNISNKDQAEKIIDVLQKWTKESGE